jgi:hypothetical protein
MGENMSSRPSQSSIIFFVKKVVNKRFFPSLELVKTHIEEVKKLLPHIKRGKSDYIVKYLGVAYDDFRKEVWVNNF